MLGILAVCAACVLAGVAESHKLRVRVERLEKFLCFLTEAETEIRYSAAPVDQIVARHSQGLRFLRRCAALCREGDAFPSAWDKSLEEEQGGLHAGDAALLRGFGAGFGTTDRQGQMAHCGLYRGLAEARLEQAEREREAKAKLCLSLGVAAGLAAALLLW